MASPGREKAASSRDAIAVDESLNFSHPVLRAALDYWKASCGSRRMPRRADIDPLTMRNLLPHIWLADVIGKPGAGLDFYIRVAGEHVDRIFSPLSRRLISEALPPESAERWRFTLGATITARKPLRFTSRIVFQQKEYLIAESLVAPLSEDDDVVSQLLGAFASWSDGTQPPGVMPHVPL